MSSLLNREQSTKDGNSASFATQLHPSPRTDSITAFSPSPSRRQSNPANKRKLPPIRKSAGITSLSSQQPVTSTTQPRRSRSPIFWGAAKEAPLYAGPLGEVVGTVPAGSVLLEASRHCDVFGGWWISTRCEDGSLGWIAYSDSTETRDSDPFSDAPLWHRVYDTRATPETASGSNGASSTRSAVPSTRMSWQHILPTVSPAEVSRPAANHFLFLDAELYTYYWATVHPEGGNQRDWNFEYQRAVELCCLTTDLTHPVAAAATGSELPEAAPPAVLDALIAAFQSEVERTVVQICREAIMPPSSRQVVVHPRFPNEVYFHNGIVLRRCVDTADGALGGDEMAMKCGRAIYRHHEMLALVAPPYALHVPLHALCTFGGFSFLCTTIPPYDTANLVEADITTMVAEGDGSIAPSCTPPSPLPRPAVVSELVRSLGDALRFEGGAVPCEWRVYTGRDRRLYLARTHRLLPPVLPLHCTKPSADQSSLPPTASEELVGTPSDLALYARLVVYRVRPEVFFSWKTAWSANECVRTPQEATEEASLPHTRNFDALGSQSWAAGAWIKSEGITHVAGTLGFQYPVAAPLLPTCSCNQCEGEIDPNELRFVVCTNPLQCCCVCMHCYTRLILGHVGEKDAPADPLGQVCSTAVRCGADCRKAGSFLMIPTLSELLHANGLNLRYLAYVLHRLPQTTRAAVEHWCHVELVARTAKHLLQQDLRRATTPIEAREVCEAFLTSLLQSSSAAAARFWRTRLGPALQSRFVGACEPFNLTVHALRLLAERVCAMLGITLSEACLASLNWISAPSDPVRSRNGENETTAAGPLEEALLKTAAPTDARDAFIEIEHIAPKTHVFPASHISRSSSIREEADVGENGEKVSPARRRAERLLLFWIGYTPKGADDALQPFYLDEAMLQRAL
ncbi:hypothetical protein JKF63_02518 [Porcisia hertigi]|uniref:Clu domain-containing protein n=1 Tax=Porcisia hertigi TaxID=2761500 RepID=A0A836I145_9TRYP|nr:hypothetical protein JKF63_02518 [Porcisia hertigi]